MVTKRRQIGNRLPRTPEITVITPTFNRREFIEACLQNVIEQRCESVEHLVIDGGSEDGTVELLASLAADYPHIRFISEPDRGQSDAMNKGIALAHGGIIGFLNVDDYYEPGVLQRVLALFRGIREPAFVAANCNVWGENQRLLEINRPRRLHITDLLMGWEINPIPANPSAYFYHRSLHERIGLYNPNDHYAMDVDFILRAVVGAKVVRHIDETWGNFRFIPGTKTYSDCKAARNWDRYNGVLAAHEAKLSQLHRVQLAVKRALWRWNRRSRAAVKDGLRLLRLRPD